MDNSEGVGQSSVVLDLNTHGMKGSCGHEKFVFFCSTFEVCDFNRVVASATKFLR